MIRIDEFLPMSIGDLQTALKGQWGAEEQSEFTDISIGQLNVRIYEDTKTIEPIQFTKGAQIDYVHSIAVVAFADGTSSIERLQNKKPYNKTISMALIIGRQVY